MEGTKCKEIPSLKKKENNRMTRREGIFLGKRGMGRLWEGGIIISCTKVMVRRKEFGG